MDHRPEQPPEGKLIAAALERSGLSIREAAKRAGISYGRWRQVTTGVQHVSPGEYAAVRAPAPTLARMALAAGITPEQLEAEGLRPDAAEMLREFQENPPAAHWEPVPDPFEQARPPGWSNSFITTELITAADKHYMKPLKARIRELQAQGIDDPSGDEMYPDSAAEAETWEAARVNTQNAEEAAWAVALAKERRTRIRGQARNPRHGSAGA